MARGTQLQDLVRMLRAEVGHSTKVSVGVDNLDGLVQKLQRTQVMLNDDYDWPFMRTEFEVQLQAGQRYYDLPFGTGGQLDMERIETVATNYSGRPTPLHRGIGFENYASFNSDNGDRASPARRWDIRRVDTAKEQIEVWPIPATNFQEIIFFQGFKKLAPLIAMSDTADIDDILIVLTTGSEILARAKSADAGSMQAAAAARLKQLKARTKGSMQIRTMGGGSDNQKNLGKTIIRIGSSTN